MRLVVMVVGATAAPPIENSSIGGVAVGQEGTILELVGFGHHAALLDP